MPSSKPVEVISWPPLWVYWPAYLALARTDEELKGSGTTLKLDPVKSGVTDQAIRDEFKRRREVGDRVMALCEPGDDVRSTTNARYPERDRIVRRLPVIWRQPHWVLWKQGGGGTSDDKGSIWAYPEETTSGDYVTEVWPHVGALENYRERKNLSPDLWQERNQVVGLGNRDCVVSFTPWHVALPALDASLGLSGSPALERALLSGPTRDVTALQVPDEGIFWNGDQGQELADHIGRNLRAVLEGLSLTYGDAGRVSDFLKSNRNSDLVREFLQKGEDLPVWADDRFLVAALSEYVKLGCYFPYRALNSAISAEIQKRVGDVLTAQRGKVLDGVQGALVNFLGAAPEWSALSFEQRLSVWTKAEMEVEDGAVRPQLWHHLAHIGDKDARTARSILISIPSQTHIGSPPYPVSGLVEKLPQECRFGREQGVRLQNCLYSGDVGDIDPKQASERTDWRCAFCVLAGAPSSLLRPAAAFLASRLSLPVEYKLGDERKGVSGRLPCPVTLEDVQHGLAAFHKEARKKPADRPVRLVCYNGFAPARGTARGHVLFGIWWNGDLTSHNGSGRTADLLRNWFDAQLNAKRPIAWVGTWLKSKDGIQESPAAQISGSAYAEIAQSLLWESAKVDFESSDFLFGYIAVFDVPAPARRM